MDSGDNRRAKYSMEQLKEVTAKATDVVGWYLHKYDTSKGGEATIRGPWNRWFTVFEGTDPKTHGNKDNCGMASAQDDAEYACVAMNALPDLIKEIERLKKIESKYNNLSSFQRTLKGSRKVARKE